ncbi:MAG TPA: porin, partial [Rhizomicrobium sp.]
MKNRLAKLAALALTATSVAALGGPAFAAAAPADNTQARLQALEDELANVNAQLGDLKRSQSDQYGDVNRQLSAVQLKIDNGRPTITTSDGNFTFALRTLVQYDTAYYAQGTVPAGTDFSSGNNFRRARFGANGTLFKDWSYEFIYDFGGS